jgi:putative ABC transport system permease protein
MLDALRQNLRYALRQLRSQPGFTAVVLFTLALGIGANTAMFSVVDAVLLRPLPYPQANRLVLLQGHKEGIGDEAASVPDYLDWKAQSRSFTEMTAVAGASLNLEGGEGRPPERLIAARVSSSFFRTLGVAPSPGRGFTAEEGKPGAARVVVLGRALWRERFGGDPSVVGRTVRLSGESYTVVGVAAPGFAFPSWAQAWTAVAPDPGAPGQGRRSDFLSVVGRLGEGATLDGARSEMTTIARRLEREYPNTNTGWGVTVTPLRQRIVGDVRPALLVLLGAVGLVLLIACANVANLLLARGAARGREIAVRAALGASRRRLVGQLLAESLLLSLLGAAAGVAVAYGGTRALLSLDPGILPRLGELSIDGTTLLFALGAALVTAILFGLAPALRLTRDDLRQDLVEGARTAGSRAAGLLDRGLVAGQVAVAFVLLVGAGLLIRSFAQLEGVDPGFRAQGVLTARVTLPASRYPDDPRIREFWRSLVERVGELPGVTESGATTDLPLESGSYLSFRVEGRPAPAPDAIQDAVVCSAGGDYFRALGIPLVRGRLLNAQDGADDRPVAVIDRAMARRYWGEKDPIGDRISFGGPAGTWYTIVGVVGDVRTESLDRPGYPHAYLSYLQSPSRGMALTIRTDGDPAALAGAVRAALAALDPTLPAYRVRTMQEIVATSVLRPRFNVVTLGAFAAAALLLALVGIYGVLSYAVSRRLHELGIRMVLGADRAATIRFVLRLGLVPVLAGVAVGLVGALVGVRVLASLLYGVSPLDPVTFLVVPTALVAVAALACLAPAARATRVDPIHALKRE